MIPRPACLLRCRPALFPRRPLPTSRLNRQASLLRTPTFPQPELDPSFTPLLGSMDMKRPRPDRSQKNRKSPRHPPSGTSQGDRPEQHELEIIDAASIGEPLLQPLPDRRSGRDGFLGREGGEGMGEEDEEDWEDPLFGMGRKSPAAVVGSKRIGSVVLPAELVGAVEKGLANVNPSDIRQSYLHLHSINPEEARARARKPRPSYPEIKTPVELQLAQAAAIMPGRYAAVRNVLEEMGRRLGKDWLVKAQETANARAGSRQTVAAKKAPDPDTQQERKGKGKEDSGELDDEEVVEREKSAKELKGAVSVVETSESLGVGLWALLDILGPLPSRNGLQLMSPDKLQIEPSSVASDDVDPAQNRASDPNVEGSSSTVSIATQPADVPFSDAAEAGIDLAGEQYTPLDYQYVTHIGPGRFMAKQFAEDLPECAGRFQFKRAIRPAALIAAPALAISSFHMLSLPSVESQNAHLLQLLRLNTPYVILVEPSSPEGWKVMSHAREYLLAQSAPEDPVFAFAPCPHDGICPMTLTRDKCSFSQRVQSPHFLRKTKHSKRGEEDFGYTYLVLARGVRPSGDILAGTGLDIAARSGRVAQEHALRRSLKEATSVIQEVESEDGVELQAVPVAAGSPSQATSSGSSAAKPDQDAVVAGVREEASTYPRLIGPPLKRSGHVVLDVCSPTGQLERMTIGKSHSKQGYYDARKAQWGDLYPHKPKTKVVPRPRGIRKLNKIGVEKTFLDLSDPENPKFSGGDRAKAAIWKDPQTMRDERRQRKGRKSNLALPKDQWSSLELPSERRERVDSEQAAKASRKQGSWVERSSIKRDRQAETRSDLYGRIADLGVSSDIESTSMHYSGAVRPTRTFSRSSTDLDQRVLQAEQALPLFHQKHVTSTRPSRRWGPANRAPVFDPGDRRAEVEIDLLSALRGSGTEVEDEAEFSKRRPSSRTSSNNPSLRMGRGSVVQRGGRNEGGRYGSKGRRTYSSVIGLQLGIPSGNSLKSVQKRYMSARPQERRAGPDPAPRAKVTINELYRLAADKVPITCLTAYDYPTALLSERAGVDLICMGDSLSQVALGHDSTTSITLDEMIHHARAVTRGAKTPFVFADLPFGSFEVSVEEGVRSAIRLVRESGVDGIKIEGGMEILPLVQRLSSIGIPAIPHLGLQPQRATSTSGYLVQGRTADLALKLYQTSKSLVEAGATMILLEAVPHPLATHITQNLSVPTIGIGAGPGTSAQVLVITDVLGTYATAKEGEGEGSATPHRPRFVRHFGKVGVESMKAVDGFVREVQGGGFPEVGKETYSMKKEEWEGYLRAIGAGVDPADEQGRVVRQGKGSKGETEDGA